MEKPSVMILCKCHDGHVVEMFPEKVLFSGHYMDESDYLFASWDCPRCEKNGKCEVNLQ